MGSSRLTGRSLYRQPVPGKRHYPLAGCPEAPGWKKADGTPVLNQQLWMALDALYASHIVTFHWVKGHAGVDLNERCDQLAKKEAMKY